MKKIKAALLLICSTIIISFIGCAAMLVMQNPKTIEKVYQETKINKDTYNKDIWIRGPKFYHTVYGGGDYYIFLRAYITDNKLNFLQIFVVDGKEEHRFYNSAYDKSGKKLEFNHVDSRISSGDSFWYFSNSVGVVEKFVITIDRDYIDNLPGIDLNFKVYGKRRNHEFKMPGHYIKGFLKKLDEYLSTNLNAPAKEKLSLEVIKSKKGKIIVLLPKNSLIEKLMKGSKDIFLKRYNKSSSNRALSSKIMIVKGKIKKITERKMLIILPEETYLPLGQYLFCFSKNSC